MTGMSMNSPDKNTTTTEMAESMIDGPVLFNLTSSIR
jgi:spore coat protein CotF